MDGGKESMNRSLQFTLSLWISIVILLIAVIGGIFSFKNAFQEANELQDDQLRQIAALVSRQDLPMPRTDVSRDKQIADSDTRIVIQALTSSKGGQPDDSPLILPNDLPDGMQTLTIQGEPWRVFAKTLADLDRMAVAQQTAVRDETARESALATVMPFIILVPLLLLVVSLLVKQLFMPVKKLALELDHRSEFDLSAISHKTLPAEIVPFVAAIDRLLMKVEKTLTSQRQFVANAAHELRTPLTALSLQAERLEMIPLPSEAQERLGTLKTGIQRSRLLLDQLLTLAKVQGPQAPAIPLTSMRKILRAVLEDLMPLAHEKSIDVGMTEECDVSIQASEIDLYSLVRNLVDNAIRYTPRGGRVDLSVRADEGQVTFGVDDTGEGIPVCERETVFIPFYRGQGNQEIGSGLGLSIVKAIADRMGATVRLADAGNASSTGLKVIVQWQKPV